MYCGGYSAGKLKDKTGPGCVPCLSLGEYWPGGVGTIATRAGADGVRLAGIGGARSTVLAETGIIGISLTYTSQAADEKGISVGLGTDVGGPTDVRGPDMARLLPDRKGAEIPDGCESAEVGVGIWEVKGRGLLCWAASAAADLGVSVSPSVK